mmetsp:Transcript_18639/g.31257  ORF Transcript_18639/g.31257 Transcript_18639/m.31257 type:complete len:319 (+) Transcript_18639:2536-3492(+)
MSSALRIWWPPSSAQSAGTSAIRGQTARRKGGSGIASASASTPAAPSASALLDVPTALSDGKAAAALFSIVSNSPLGCISPCSSCMSASFPLDCSAAGGSIYVADGLRSANILHPLLLLLLLLLLLSLFPRRTLRKQPSCESVTSMLSYSSAMLSILPGLTTGDPSAFTSPALIPAARMGPLLLQSRRISCAISARNSSQPPTPTPAPTPAPPTPALLSPSTSSMLAPSFEVSLVVSSCCNATCASATGINSAMASTTSSRNMIRRASPPPPPPPAAVPAAAPFPAGGFFFAGGAAAAPSIGTISRYTTFSSTNREWQ